jgi:hypothetical protein
VQPAFAASFKTAFKADAFHEHQQSNTSFYSKFSSPLPKNLSDDKK